MFDWRELRDSVTGKRLDEVGAGQELDSWVWRVIGGDPHFSPGWRSSSELLEWMSLQELDSWVWQLVEGGEGGVPPFSTDWGAGGKLLEWMTFHEYIVSLSFLNLRRGFNVELRQEQGEEVPEREQRSIWSCGFLGKLESQFAGEDESPLVAICRGVIWLHAYNREDNEE